MLWYAGGGFPEGESGGAEGLDPEEVSDSSSLPDRVTGDRVQYSVNSEFPPSLDSGSTGGPPRVFPLTTIT